jgi:hypothetical protein
MLLHVGTREKVEGFVPGGNSEVGSITSSYVSETIKKQYM